MFFRSPRGVSAFFFPQGFKHISCDRVFQSAGECEGDGIEVSGAEVYGGIRRGKGRRGWSSFVDPLLIFFPVVIVE